jgi:predicted ArsR family transcriptional regulator
LIASSFDAEKRAGTRERIIELLLKGQRSVEELAGTLGLTRNAVRSQLALLQREGLVEVKGEIKGSRRPAAVFGIHTKADVGSSQAYAVVLSQLVKVLSDGMPAKQMESLMKQVGQGLAATVPLPIGNARERIAGAVNVLKSLGSRADVSEEDGKFVVTGNGCPISKAVTVDVRSCLVMESLLGTLTGLPVSERCNHGNRPNCRFEITLPAEERRKA